MSNTETSPALYAIVAIMGHQRIAGRVSEQTFAGASFVRVDVPEIPAIGETIVGGIRRDGTPGIAAHTRTLGAAVIFSIDWCDEETALVAAMNIRHTPVQPYELRQAIADLPDKQRHRLLTSHRESDLELDHPF